MSLDPRKADPRSMPAGTRWFDDVDVGLLGWLPSGTSKDFTGIAFEDGKSWPVNRSVSKPTRLVLGCLRMLSGVICLPETPDGRLAALLDLRIDEVRPLLQHCAALRQVLGAFVADALILAVRKREHYADLNIGTILFASASRSLSR